ncbi:MAG: glycosyltransferase family 4 protein [Candidatus Algichlamydia australiensis]|nr:glycosyltransferase family 4 protein [Chlamydiales bacterium]
MKLLFFADRLPPLTGGVEMHARYFLEHFPVQEIVKKGMPTEEGDILFFNSGRWIEELRILRKRFPKAKFVYRTGGNEILKAPLEKKVISNHKLRQKFWAQEINATIDCLITNSKYTEDRLREIGIKVPFKRVVGGVNTHALKQRRNVNKPITLFCSARFVPYKNHHLLITSFQELLRRGYELELRLAGDGPLLNKMKNLACENLKFLGELSNEESCREIAQADIYIQLSCNHLTKVPGGSYIHSEGMGRSFLEAITAGTFIIAGRSGALEEIIYGDRGKIIDFDKVADQMEPYLKKPFEKNPFTDEYSWKNVFKKYEEIFS